MTLYLRLGLIALLVAALSGAGWFARSVLAERAELRDKLAVAEEGMRLVKRAAAATESTLSARVASKAAIQTITKEIIREVPVYLPASTPALPPGFRVLHDAAVQGVTPPAAALGPDAAPVAAQDAAETIIDNYGSCRDTADQLDKLQQWVRGVTR